MLVGPKWASRFLGHSYMGRMHQPPFPLGRSLKRPFLEHIPIGQRARRRRASSVSPPAGSPRCESSAPIPRSLAPMHRLSSPSRSHFTSMSSAAPHWLLPPPVPTRRVSPPMASPNPPVFRCVFLS